MTNHAPQARLEFNDDHGRRVVRIDQDLFRIGRRQTHELYLNGNEVSRDHAEIHRRDGHYFLVDNGSRFGVHVNGTKITEHRLAHFDRIRFGSGEPEVTFFETATGSTERSADLAVGDLRQVAALFEGLRAVGSTRALDDVLALVLDSAIDVTGAERGFVMLRGERGDLEFKCGRARGREMLDGNVFGTSRKIPEQVFQTGKAAFVMDMLEGNWAESHGATIAMGIRHVRAVPLSVVVFADRRGESGSEERRIGVLYLDSKDRAAMESPVTATALETLAREASVAIENARLYREALEKTRMEQELRIAAEMQQALLPSRRKEATGYEVVGTMVSCLAIGGDFFDYFDLPGGGAGFVLCDVSGKGAPAALMTAMIQGVFRALASESTGAAATLDRVNRVLCARAVKSRYATGFYGMLFPDGRFVSSNAGHNPPIVVRKSGKVERLEQGGMPLGMFANAAYEEEMMHLEPGDTLLLFSDGLSEAVNPDGDEFGDERLIAAVLESRSGSPEELLNAVFSKARTFAGSAPQSDDMTALVIRHKSTAS